MNYFRRGKNAQTFVFFLVSFGAVFLLCGLGLDMGLWYLDRTRLSRACDSAVITGVANFGKVTGTNSADIAVARQAVADKMRNVAAANYYGLKSISSSVTRTATSVNSQGGLDYLYYYTTTPTTNNAGVRITISTGLLGQITLAEASAWSKTYTSFMGFSGIAGLKQLNTKAVAQAQRRPRLIMLVLDRSGSMTSNGGSTTLPVAVTNFLSLMKNDAGNNSVGMVSFSWFARLEMAPTTNFWVNGTNKLYRTDSSSVNPSGMKFNGYTCADEGMRMALEVMKTNEGFTNPQTVKFIVFFTDGQFNTVRTLWAAPTWTNVVYMPSNAVPTASMSNQYTNDVPFMDASTGTNYLIGDNNRPGTPQEYKELAYLASITTTSSSRGHVTTTSTAINKYLTNLNVWMQPGSVNITYMTNGSGGWVVSTNYSRLTNSTLAVKLKQFGSNVLIVPGFVVDGNAYASAPSSSDYSTASLNGANLFSTFDIGLPMDDGLSSTAGYYPNGIAYWLIDESGSYTNLMTCTNDTAGTLFYAKISNVVQEMTTTSQWLQGAPSWLTNEFRAVMVTNNSAGRYYAGTFDGYKYTNNVTNYTGGAIIINSTTTNINSMAWNGRATHFYDFERGTWTNITNWDVSGNNTPQTLELCNWKVETYADQARRAGVIMYSVGFSQADPDVLGTMANDPQNSTNFQVSQPQGKFYQCTSASQISVYFAQIAQQILAFLSQ